MSTDAFLFCFVACAECWLAGSWFVVRAEPWVSPGNLLALSAGAGLCCAVYDCLRVQVRPAHHSTWLRAVRVRTVLAVFAHLYLPFLVLVLAGSVLGGRCCCRTPGHGLCSLAYHTLRTLAWWTWLLLALHTHRAWLPAAIACLYFLRVQPRSRLLRVVVLKLCLLWGLSHWDVPPA
tara:strand:- start:235 stop:765 length:531 start_codon:yes stop_codon:yes gene_type:complete